MTEIDWQPLDSELQTKGYHRASENDQGCEVKTSFGKVWATVWTTPPLDYAIIYRWETPHIIRTDEDLRLIKKQNEDDAKLAATNAIRWFRENGFDKYADAIEQTIGKAGAL